MRKGADVSTPHNDFHRSGSAFDCRCLRRPSRASKRSRPLRTDETDEAIKAATSPLLAGEDVPRPKTGETADADVTSRARGSRCRDEGGSAHALPVTGTSSTRTQATRTRSRPTSRPACRTSTSVTTSSRWKFPSKRSPRSRTASASRSTARFCPATSSSAWNSTTSPGELSATPQASPVSSVPPRKPSPLTHQRGRQVPACRRKAAKKDAKSDRRRSGSSRRRYHVERPDHRGRLRGRRVGHRHGRPVRDPPRQRSARSTQSSRSSRCWYRSSAVKHRSSSAFTQVSKI